MSPLTKQNESNIDIAQRRATQCVHHIPDLDRRRKRRDINDVIQGGVRAGEEIHEDVGAMDVLDTVQC